MRRVRTIDSSSEDELHEDNLQSDATAEVLHEDLSKESAADIDRRDVPSTSKCAEPVVEQSFLIDAQTDEILPSLSSHQDVVEKSETELFLKNADLTVNENHSQVQQTESQHDVKCADDRSDFLSSFNFPASPLHEQRCVDRYRVGPPTPPPDFSELDRVFDEADRTGRLSPVDVQAFASEWFKPRTELPGSRDEGIANGTSERCASQDSVELPKVSPVGTPLKDVLINRACASTSTPLSKLVSQPRTPRAQGASLVSSTAPCNTTQVSFTTALNCLDSFNASLTPAQATPHSGSPSLLPQSPPRSPGTQDHDHADDVDVPLFQHSPEAAHGDICDRNAHVQLTGNFVPDTEISPVRGDVLSPSSHTSGAKFDLGLDFDVDSDEIIPPSPPDACAMSVTSCASQAPVGDKSQCTQSFAPASSAKNLYPNLIGGLGAKVFLTPSQTTSDRSGRDDVIKTDDKHNLTESNDRSDSECSDLLLVDPAPVLKSTTPSPTSPRDDEVSLMAPAEMVASSVPVARVTPLTSGAKESTEKPDSEDLFTSEHDTSELNAHFNLSFDALDTRPQTPAASSRQTPLHDVTAVSNESESPLIGRVRRGRARILSPETPMDESRIGTGAQFIKSLFRSSLECKTFTSVVHFRSSKERAQWFFSQASPHNVRPPSEPCCNVVSAAK